MLPEKCEKASGEPSRFTKEIEQLRIAQLANETKKDDTSEKEKPTEEESPSERERTDEPAQETKKPEEVIADETSETNHTERGGSATVPESAPELTEESVAQPQNSGPEPVVSQVNPVIEVQWLTDPVLNVAIVLLAVISYLLYRKAHSLMVELSELSDIQR